MPSAPTSARTLRKEVEGRLAKRDEELVCTPYLGKLLDDPRLGTHIPYHLLVSYTITIEQPGPRVSYGSRTASRVSSLVERRHARYMPRIPIVSLEPLAIPLCPFVHPIDILLGPLFTQHTLDDRPLRVSSASPLPSSN